MYPRASAVMLLPLLLQVFHWQEGQSLSTGNKNQKLQNQVFARMESVNLASYWDAPGDLSRVASRRSNVIDGTEISRGSFLRQSATIAAATALFPASSSASAVGTILVTGGNSGIGKATAEQLCSKGYNVILGCRAIEKAQSTANQIGQTIQDAGGVSPTIFCPQSPLELSDLNLVREYAADVRSSISSLDGIVLCAGIDGAPEVRTPQGNELHMSVNHLGHMLLTAELTSLLRRSNLGCAKVISMTSSAALDALPDYLDDLAWTKHSYNKRQAYCVSKACNILFTDHLAAREGAGIRTAAVDPGPTVTQIVRYELPQRAQQRMGMTAEQLERQARQLGFRTPRQAGSVVSSLIGSTEKDRPTFVTGGLYLGIAAAPGQIGPLITEPISWRTPIQAEKVWAASAELLRSYASSNAIF